MDSETKLQTDVGAKEGLSSARSARCLSDLLCEAKGDITWLIKTLEWIADKNTNGGITTCTKHNGNGFISDCAICSHVKMLKSKHT